MRATISLGSRMRGEGRLLVRTNPAPAAGGKGCPPIVVQLLRVGRAEVEHLAERGDGGFGRQGAGGGELRLRVDDAGDEQGEDEVAVVAGAAGEQGSESELADGGEHGGDVAVGEAAEAGEGVIGMNELLAAEDASEGVDGGVGELGEVGEGSLLDARSIAEGLAEEDGGR